MDFNFLIALFQAGIFKNNPGLLIQLFGIINADIARNAQNRSTPASTPALSGAQLIGLNGISSLKTILQSDSKINLPNIPVNKTEEFTLGTVFLSKYLPSGTSPLSSAAHTNQSISALA